MPSPRLRIQTVSNTNLSSLLAVVSHGARKNEREVRDLCQPPMRSPSRMHWRFLNIKQRFSQMQYNLHIPTADSEIFSVQSGRSVFYSYLTCFFLARALGFKHGDSLTIPIEVKRPFPCQRFTMQSPHSKTTKVFH